MVVARAARQECEQKKRRQPINKESIMIIHFFSQASLGTWGSCFLQATPAAVERSLLSVLVFFGFGKLEILFYNLRLDEVEEEESFDESFRVSHPCVV